VQETLRLYPTVPLSIRSSIRDTTMSVKGENIKIPRGTRVMLVPWAINRNPALWGPNACDFTPERWLEPGMGNSGGATSNFANITFFHGPRSCIGQGFAKAEFKCLLAALTGAMKWEMADPTGRDQSATQLYEFLSESRTNLPTEVVYPAGVITTKPAHGMHVRIEREENW